RRKSGRPRARRHVFDRRIGELDQPDQLVHRRALGTHRGRFLSDTLDTGALAGIIGCIPDDVALYDLALTHGSTGRADYQRLEFLGDRVLGLVIASELYTRFPAASEGEMSSRLHVLASGATCATIAQK